ncbi:MAG TPA: hypothetical protein VG960_13585 [Caulobacteraceae bacterium]|nr:hypothetical protein [Caulobacteraceae bacterium]
MKRLALTLALAASLASNARSEAPAVNHVEGALADGAAWVIDKPSNWNGTLLIWSHGYSARLGPPLDAPSDVKAWVLAQGYALAASSYARAGWALEQAVPDQIGVVQVFEDRFGHPKRTIAWGDSMGGLVTLALAEQYPERISGALAGCGPIAGAVGMMNMALDGAFTFKTLLAPTSDIALVHVSDDRQNAQRVQAVIDQAQGSPAGRARLALASAMAQEAGWTDPKAAEPAAEDYDGRQVEAAKSFNMGVFLPRADQEARAGGVFSWNTKVDYSAQLERSGKGSMVRALYAKAGLDLRSDLDALAKAPRITADPAAVAYMAAHYSPSGDLRIPLLTMHTMGDGLTSVANESAYAGYAKRAGRSANLAQIFVRGAGHCAFTPSEREAALKTLELRLDGAAWSLSPKTLRSRAAGADPAQVRFVAFSPPPFLRPYPTKPPLPAAGSKDHE